MQLAALILAVVAYWRLLRFDPQPQEELLRELEEWFFVPTDTSPLVVVLLAGWLIYRRRDSWLPLIGSASARAASFAFFAFAFAAHAWARTVGADDLLAFSLAASLLGLGALLGGRPGLRAVTLPAAFVLFAVPLPGPFMNALLYQLQLWTADYVGFVLNAVGFAAYVSNDQVLLAGSHFEVIEGCSGLRSVQTLTMVSVLLVDLFGRRGLHAWAIVLLAPFVAFALNGVRVITLILNPSSEIAAVHNIQGIAILLGGVLILYGVDGGLERWRGVASARPRGAAPAPAARAAGAVSRWGPLIAMGALAVLSIAVPDRSRPIEPRSVVQRKLSQALQGVDRAWRREALKTDGAFLGTLGRQPYIDYEFVYEGARRDSARTGEAADAPEPSEAEARLGDAPVRLFQMRGDPANRLYSAVSRKTRYPGSGWEIEQRGERALPEILGDGSADRRSAEWNVMRSGTRRELVVHWREQSYGVARETWRALLGLDALPSSEPRRITVVRLSTPLARGDEASRALGQARIDALVEVLAPGWQKERSGG